MKDVYFLNDIELQRYLKTLTRFEEQGNNGITYHNGKIVVKYVYRRYHGKSKDLLQFRDISIKDFYFVKAAIYLYLRKNIRCTISKYASGEMLLRDDISYVNIDVLLKALARLERSVKELSHASIRASDVNNPCNILFDKDHFNFIDTTEYYYSLDNFEKIYRENMKDITDILFKRIMSSSLRLKFSIYERGEVFLHPSESLYDFCEHLIRQGYEFDTFEELNRHLMMRRYY